MSAVTKNLTDPSGVIRGEKNLASLSKQYSSRDLPSHTKLKYRKYGQSSSEELKGKDFKRELIEKERKSSSFQSSSSSNRLSLPPSSSSKKLRLDQPSNPDADDKRLLVDSDDETEDSDEDDTAELLAELNRIKQERAAEEAKKEAERKEQEEKIRLENILKGNPLLTSNKTEFKVKRRWDDDVVFKNCARDESNQNEKNFINDTLRSEFHKKFMEKYIK